VRIAKAQVVDFVFVAAEYLRVTLEVVALPQSNLTMNIVEYVS
jgi:hypothetical protein